MMNEGLNNKLQKKQTLSGKVAIVTGASSGIGEATALVFADAGATVVLAARRAKRLVHLAEEIDGCGGLAIPVPTDLTERDQITNLVQTTYQTFGRIDILANIAGWGKYDWFEEFTPQELREQYEVNVLGLAELIRQVLPIMKLQRSGHILNMSSYASRIATPPLTVYASTKYAVEGLSDGLRRELRPWGIHVSRIHPSGVKGTEFNRRAARKGGIRFRSLPIGKVTREQLAKKTLEVVENPQPELFYSRLYDVLQFINRRFPGLVDLVSSAWVRWKRSSELSELKEGPPGITQSLRLANIGPMILNSFFILVALGLVYRKKPRL